MMELVINESGYSWKIESGETKYPIFPVSTKRLLKVLNLNVSIPNSPIIKYGNRKINATSRIIDNEY